MAEAFQLFLNKVGAKLHLFVPFMPFTQIGIVSALIISRGSNIIDIGCGKGGPMKMFKNMKRHFYAVGVDIFKPYLKRCKAESSHDDLILCDVRKLPLRQASVDIVICMEVLEHLSKKEGLALLYAMERIARKQVVITTPSRFFKNVPWDGNPYEIHRSHWSPSDFKKREYKVRGVGLRGVGILQKLGRGIGRNHLVIAPSRDYLWAIGTFLQILTEPFVYFIPQLAEGQVCFKRI